MTAEELAAETAEATKDAARGDTTEHDEVAKDLE